MAIKKLAEKAEAGPTVKGTTITDHKLAEQRLQDLIKLIPGVIYRCKSTGDFGATYVSEQVENVLGYKPQAFIENSSFWRDHVHPDDREAALKKLSVVIETGAHTHEYRFLHADCGYRWVRDKLHLVSDEQGRPVEIVGLWMDITEHKRTEDALRAAEEQFRSLVEQTIAGIYIIQDGRLAYVNRRYAEIFGYASAEQLIGSDPLSLVAEKDRALSAERLRKRLEGEAENISFGFVGIRKDGAAIDVGVQGARATHRGRPAVVGLMQDISEKKRAEAQIQQYIAQLETAFMRTVGVATALSEMRDPYTAGHERRVAEIAVAIGAELGFDARRQEGLRVAGYLHDVGKITIPSEILSKPGRLSALEYQLIKGHAQASFDVMKEVEFPWPVAQVALQHHERLDGSGYPQGLASEAILLEARIMAVADVIEAMSSHRPYRPGLGIDTALAEIERGRGTAYDPVVADACLKLFREKGYAIPA